MLVKYHGLQLNQKLRYILQDIFTYNSRVTVLVVRWLLCSGTHTVRVSVLTVFEIFAVKWQKLVSQMPKMVHPKPILTLHLDTPKDIATKRGEALSGTQLYHRAEFHTDHCHLHRDICPQT